MKFIAVAVGILTLMAADGPFRLTLDHNLAATAAAAAAAENAGTAGIKGNPQKGAGVSGSSKANPSINGSQIRGKR